MTWIEYKRSQNKDNILTNIVNGNTPTENYILATIQTREQAQAILQEIQKNLSKVVKQSIEEAMKELGTTEISITVRS